MSKSIPWHQGRGKADGPGDKRTPYLSRTRCTGPGNPLVSPHCRYDLPCQKKSHHLLNQQFPKLAVLPGP